MHEHTDGVDGYIQQLSTPSPDVTQILQPEGVKPGPNLFDSIKALHRLPFIPGSDLSRALHYPYEMETQYISGVKVPVTRIIGARAFQSWAGRGLYKGAPVLKGGVPSALVIQEYAKRRPDWKTEDPVLQLFRDSSEDVWAFVDTDGAHRTAAAKLRGDKVIRCTLATATYENLPRIHYDVSQSVRAHDRWAQSLLGRRVLAKESLRLARASGDASKIGLRTGQRLRSNQRWNRP